MDTLYQLIVYGNGTDRRPTIDRYFYAQAPHKDEGAPPYVIYHVNMVAGKNYAELLIVEHGTLHASKQTPHTSAVLVHTHNPRW